MNYIDAIFFKHPKENNMTFCEHFHFSSILSCLFCCASTHACIHSFVPYLFQTSSTYYNEIITEKIEKNHYSMNMKRTYTDRKEK